MGLLAKLKYYIRHLFPLKKADTVIHVIAPYQSYIDNGNLSVGQNSDISNLRISFHDTEKGFLNVSIGDDCEIHGRILVYNNNAKIKIGNKVYIGQDTMLFCYEGIEIMDNTMISWGCTLIDTNAHSLKSKERMNDVTDWKKGWQYKDWSCVESKYITVGSKVWIGFNSIIMKGVTIGEGGVVAAGSVLTKDVDKFTVVGGNPARILKETD